MQSVNSDNLKGELILSVSIFYNQVGWHILVLNGIIPFVEKTREVKDYFFFLSRKRGDHIRLFLLTSKLKAKRLSLKIDSYFREFVIKNKLITDTNLIPKSEENFCDFDTNTVHYGLYEYSLSELFNHSIRWHKEFSKLLIFVFKKHGRDVVTNITEIMIELLALFYDTIDMEYSEGILFFDELLKIEFQKYDPKSLKKTKALSKINFEENKKDIVFFLGTVGDESEKSEPYQKQWIYMIKEHHKWLSPKVKNKSKYLINTLGNVFDLEDRISPYYLFVNALKVFPNK